MLVNDDFDVEWFFNKRKLYELLLNWRCCGSTYWYDTVGIILRTVFRKFTLIRKGRCGVSFCERKLFKFKVVFEL